MADSEFAFIERIRDVLGTRNAGVTLGIGDDAAVLAGGICVTCDLLVEDVHFRRSTTPLDALGWKALAVNVSDLAAMGATPTAALVGLGVPGWIAEQDMVELYRGLDGCAAVFELDVVGGDVVRAPGLLLSVTAIGTAALPALRDGARVGDVLAVTGPLGGSRAGFALLEREVERPPEADELVDRHLRPQPRVAEGRLLAPVVHAMLDLSDGLASDATRLARASGVTCRIDLDAVPADAGVAAVAAETGRSAGWYAAAGGEDYELLVALAPDDVAGAPVPLTVVGEVVEGPAGTVLFTGAGSDEPPREFDHLAPERA